MTQETLQRYADVVAVNADRIALELSLLLKNEPPEVQRKTFGGSREAGWFYLYHNAKHPDSMFECVMSQEGGDSITALYKTNRIFGSVGELISARETLIRAIAEKVGLSREAVGIEDPGRGRTVGLVDLSTGQLIDMLAEKVGSSIVVANNHSAAGLVDAGFKG